jgi:hypothetical protein
LPRGEMRRLCAQVLALRCLQLQMVLQEVCGLLQRLVLTKICLEAVME